MTSAHANDRLVVAGGTIAALVAADAAARAGRDVDLLLPRKGVGGGFAPVTVDGRRLERGVRLLELRQEQRPEPPPIADYRPEVGYRPWITLVEGYMAELLRSELVEIEPPQMFFDGRLRPEIHLTTDLSSLRESLGAERADAVADEALKAWREADHEAGVLAGGADLWARPLSEASVLNHGPTFHRLLIDPLCRKLRAAGGDDVPAPLRRKLWMPLFYPRTLWEACTGRAIGFRAHRPFHSASPGGTGLVVDRMLAHVEDHERVNVRRIDGVERIVADGAQVRLELAGGETVSSHRPVLGLSPPELFAATGVEYAPERVWSLLHWVEVAADDLLELPSVLHVVDPDVPLFRLTAGERDPDRGRRILTLELPHDVEKDLAAATARRALEQIGIVREGAPLDDLATFGGATFTAPTADSRRQFDAARTELDATGIDAEIIGGAGAFGADSLNDQVVQGLRAGAAAGGV